MKTFKLNGTIEYAFNNLRIARILDALIGCDARFNPSLAREGTRGNTVW